MIYTYILQINNVVCMCSRRQLQLPRGCIWCVISLAWIPAAWQAKSLVAFPNQLDFRKKKKNQLDWRSVHRQSNVMDWGDGSWASSWATRWAFQVLPLEQEQDNKGPKRHGNGHRKEYTELDSSSSSVRLLYLFLLSLPIPCYSQSKLPLILPPNCISTAVVANW